MKKKFKILGLLMVFSTALTGCDKKEVPVAAETDLGKQLIDQAKDAVNNANQSNPDQLLNSLTGD
ncbi:MAG: hypothetical protein J6O53_01610 [Eubacterium sp.]|nr:hypothetical protein [Eubacterium sp.]